MKNLTTYWPVYQYVPDNAYLVCLPMRHVCIVVFVDLGKHTIHGYGHGYVVCSQVG